MVEIIPPSDGPGGVSRLPGPLAVSGFPFTMPKTLCYYLF